MVKSLKTVHSMKEESATMPTNFKKFAALAVLATLGLTACNNEIIAKPTDYEDPIVTIEGYDEEIYNNVLSVVYDAIHDGTLPSETLDAVLYQFAISVVGNYNTITSDIEGVTLKQAAASAQDGADKTNANAFVLAHKAYWDEDREEGSTNPASESELARITAKWNTIEERIAEKMYKEITSGSYSDRNIFSEQDYLYTLYSGMDKVANPANVSTFTKMLVTPDIEDTEVFSKGVLHREYYQDSTLDEANAKYTFVEDEIIPTIYRELLVEQYILDETYNTLGRSYARKVNVVSIAVNKEYPLAANYLVNEFVETYINTNKEVGLAEFKLLSNAWKGVDVNNENVYNLLNGAGLTGVDSNSDNKYEYFLGTAYGDLMDDYNKISDDPLLNDSSIESTFTNNNSYTKEVGLEIKTNEIKLKDHTENGWYIKNGGLSNLPDDIRTRLFNIGVANELNDEDVLDRKDNGFKKYANEDDTNSYIARINGKSYLKVPETESSNTDKDMLFYDTASSTYYIIQIEEAASSSKLSKDSENNYAEIYDDAEKMEEIVADVARVVAENDSYKTLSTKHWLEKADLQYHDEAVYDYFLENYPDLFE